MRSTIDIDIAAPPELVFALAHDVERWATLLPHYARSRAVERDSDGSVVVDFIARRSVIGLLGDAVGFGIPVTWRARTWNEPASRHLRFVHVAGATKGMDVTWRIDAVGGGARVSIDHDFRPRVPRFAAFVDRAFTQPIAGQTLATFKALAEVLAGAAEAPASALAWPAATARESKSPETTNPPT